MKEYFLAGERQALMDAGDGYVSAETLDVVKGIVGKHVEVALSEYVGEDGLPIHLPMAVNRDGSGPESWFNKQDAMVCWCADADCWMNKALRQQEAIDLRKSEKQTHGVQGKIARLRDRYEF